MKQHQWKINRQFIERPDAQRRWDQAYQSLMSWTLCPTSSTITEKAQTKQEEPNENSRVRPSLYPASGSDANH